MAKQPNRHGRAWTSQQVDRLWNLALENTPTRVIGLKLGRTEDAVRSKAAVQNISLKPTKPVATQQEEVDSALSLRAGLKGQRVQ